MRDQLSIVRRSLGFLGVCLLTLGAIAAPERAQSAQDPIYVFHTSLGNIAVQLYPDVAPKTVANFLSYVNNGGYTVFGKIVDAASFAVDVSVVP